MLAMNRKDVFHGVVALSPDSDFETTINDRAGVHRARGETGRLDAAMAPAGKWASRERSNRTARHGIVRELTRRPADQPGRFDWLYNERGEWREMSGNAGSLSIR
jgi:hypothetical protein